jgi:hypothetical protein
MEPLQFETKISSLTEIKIPEHLKEKIKLNQQVQVVLLPTGEKMYDDWQENEWDKLSQLNDDGE